MMPATRKVAILYSLWAMLCISLAAIDYADSMAGHLLLALTGIPLSLFSLLIVPNGSVFATALAGAMGLVQWCVLAEGFSRWDNWRASKRGSKT
jgi:hypothetical protein